MQQSNLSDLACETFQRCFPSGLFAGTSLDLSNLTLPARSLLQPSCLPFPSLPSSLLTFLFVLSFIVIPLLLLSLAPLIHPLMISFPFIDAFFSTDLECLQEWKTGEYGVFASPSEDWRDDFLWRDL